MPRRAGGFLAVPALKRFEVLDSFQRLQTLDVQTLAHKGEHSAWSHASIWRTQHSAIQQLQTRPKPEYCWGGVAYKIYIRIRMYIIYIYYVCVYVCVWVCVCGSAKPGQKRLGNANLPRKEENSSHLSFSEMLTGRKLLRQWPLTRDLAIVRSGGYVHGAAGAWHSRRASK